MISFNIWVTSMNMRGVNLPTSSDGRLSSLQRDIGTCGHRASFAQAQMPCFDLIFTALAARCFNLMRQACYKQTSLKGRVRGWLAKVG